jgi:hypothetical protein
LAFPIFNVVIGANPLKSFHFNSLAADMSPLKSNSRSTRPIDRADLSGSWEPFFDFFRTHWDHEPLPSFALSNLGRSFSLSQRERAGVRENRSNENLVRFMGRESCSNKNVRFMERYDSGIIETFQDHRAKTVSTIQHFNESRTQHFRHQPICRMLFCLYRRCQTQRSNHFGRFWADGREFHGGKSLQEFGQIEPHVGKSHR